MFHFLLCIELKPSSQKNAAGIKLSDTRSPERKQNRTIPLACAPARHRAGKSICETSGTGSHWWEKQGACGGRPCETYQAHAPYVCHLPSLDGMQAEWLAVLSGVCRRWVS